jgi:hypothetical protein
MFLSSFTDTGETGEPAPTTRAGAFASVGVRGPSNRQGLDVGELGHFNLSPELDMGNDFVKARVPAGRPLRANLRCEVAELRLADPPRQEGRFELVETVEEIVPSLEGPATSLRRVGFSLNGEKSVERAERRRGRGSAAPARITRSIQGKALSRNAPL